MTDDHAKPQQEHELSPTKEKTSPSESLLEWTKKVLECTNRASIDEEYRKELAKRIR